MFSWLGLAPALANVAGPVLAGALIDHAGFRRRLRRAQRCCRWSPGGGRAGCRSSRSARPDRPRSAAQLVGTAGRTRIPAPAARQLAAVVELGRAHVPGADARPRARLQRVGDRPRARRVRERGGRDPGRDPVDRAPAARSAGAGRRDADDARGVPASTRSRRRPGRWALCAARARPRARRGAADDHGDAAPDHARPAPRRGDRACAR